VSLTFELLNVTTASRMSNVEVNHLRTWLNCCGLVWVQANNDCCTDLLQLNYMASVKNQANLINVNEGTFISLLQTVNSPVEIQHEEFIKRTFRLKSASKNVHLDYIILSNENILWENYKLISNLKTVILHSVTLLLCPELEVHFLWIDYVHLQLISPKCVQSAACLAMRYLSV